MKLRIGPPATGENFYKRPKLISSLLRSLSRGNVAFLGPRRTGKTSCLEEIRAHPSHFVPILLNLEKHDNVVAWLAEMVNALHIAFDKPAVATTARASAQFLDRLKKIQLGPVGVEIGEKSKVSWRPVADQLLKELRDAKQPILFLLDEFPTFLKLIAKKDGPSEVEAVLNWFRAARNELKDTQVRFLVTGSIGLRGVVRKLGLAPSINEFDTKDIPPLTTDEALGLLQELSKSEGVPLNPQNCRVILRLLGANWPILLQEFVAAIQEQDFASFPTSAQLTKIYREKLVHGSGNAYCDGMYDRLPEIFSDSECRLARALLRATAKSPKGLSRPEYEAIHEALVPNAGQRTALYDELDHVLDTLKHDGYLLQQTSRGGLTRFASNILLDFWLRKTT